MRVTSTQTVSASTRISSPALVQSLLASCSRRVKASRSRRSQPSEQGLTIIECLVAIVIISLTVVAITPPIMLATASRIQSRKVEKANQVAQGEIDRVRLLVERGSYELNDLPGTTGSINSASTISSFGAATGSPSGAPLYTTASTASCPGTRYPDPTTPAPTPVAATGLIRVDVDGDCVPEYVMQVFRTPGYAPTPPTPTVPFSFEMGVRVYAYYPNQTFVPLDTTRASVRMSAGPLDLAGGRRRPMAVLYSKMARNDSSRSLGQLCMQNVGASGQTCNY